jgi:hypothetical protein
MEHRMSPWNWTIMFHLVVDHLADQMAEWGPVRDTWMFAYESFFGLLKKFARNRSAPVATIMRARQASRAVNLVVALFNQEVALRRGTPLGYDSLFRSLSSPCKQLTALLFSRVSPALYMLNVLA